MLCLFYLYVRAAKYILHVTNMCLPVAIQSVGGQVTLALTGPSRYQSMTLAAGCVRKESPLCRKFTSRGVHSSVVGGSSQDVFQTSKSCGLNHQIVLRHGFPPPCVSGRWHQGLYGRDCSSMFIHVSAGAGCVLK